jgi:hypothetical protein
MYGIKRVAASVGDRQIGGYYSACPAAFLGRPLRCGMLQRLAERHRKTETDSGR